MKQSITLTALCHINVVILSTLQHCNDALRYLEDSNEHYAVAIAAATPCWRTDSSSSPYGELSRFVGGHDSVRASMIWPWRYTRASTTGYGLSDAETYCVAQLESKDKYDRLMRLYTCPVFYQPRLSPSCQSPEISVVAINGRAFLSSENKSSHARMTRRMASSPTAPVTTCIPNALPLKSA